MGNCNWWTVFPFNIYDLFILKASATIDFFVVDMCT